MKNTERYEIWGCSHMNILQDIHETEIWNELLCRMEKVWVFALRVSWDFLTYFDKWCLISENVFEMVRNLKQKISNFVIITIPA